MAAWQIHTTKHGLRACVFVGYRPSVSGRSLPQKRSCLHKRCARDQIAGSRRVILSTRCLFSRPRGPDWGRFTLTNLKYQVSHCGVIHFEGADLMLRDVKQIVLLVTAEQ
jgi:hypothetical protein